MTQYPDDIIAEMALAACEAGASWMQAPLHEMAYQDIARACWSVVEKRMGWRPIETLPEDTPALLHSPFDEDSFVGSFRWVQRSEWETVSVSSGKSGARREIRQEKITREREWIADSWTATHWQPLPPPPSSSDEPNAEDRSRQEKTTTKEEE